MSSDTSQSPSPASVAQKRARWRDFFVLGGLLGITVFGLAGLAAATGWEETITAIRSLTLPMIAALLALSLANYGCRGLRWHLFANQLGLNTTLLQNLRHFIGGFAMSVTPGRVGELVRMRWIRRETGWSFERTAPLVLVDRAADLAAMGLILGLTLALSASGISGAVPVTILAIAAAFVVTRPQLLRTAGDLVYRIIGRFPRLFVRLRGAARSLDQFTSPNVVAIAALLGVVGWMAEGVAFHYLLVWMGADIGLWTAIAIFIFSTLAGGLTGAPGGVGGAEAAMIALLAVEGVPIELSIPATLVIRLTTLWFAILLGLIVFPIAEQRSRTSQYVVED